MGTITKLITANPRRPKKAKQVTGNKAKLKTLADLKKVNQKLDKERSADEKRFKKMDKLFTKSRKLKEQLGIE